ncbi:hypothetical protein MYX07_02815 [Patescibacteria group bacterium AH-259-L07]|nr:hypothetical protein [Patescibacteria group bacterium AH-259-L07]
MRYDDNCRKAEGAYLLSLHQERQTKMFATVCARGSIESAVIISYSKSFFAYGLGGKIVGYGRER